MTTTLTAPAPLLPAAYVPAFVSLMRTSAGQGDITGCYSIWTPGRPSHGGQRIRRQQEIGFAVVRRVKP